jgi:hypothetical protein
LDIVRIVEFTSTTSDYNYSLNTNPFERILSAKELSSNTYELITQNDLKYHIRELSTNSPAESKLIDAGNKYVLTSFEDTQETTDVFFPLSDIPPGILGLLSNEGTGNTPYEPSNEGVLYTNLVFPGISTISLREICSDVNDENVTNLNYYYIYPKLGTNVL